MYLCMYVCMLYVCMYVCMCMCVVYHRGAPEGAHAAPARRRAAALLAGIFIYFPHIRGSAPAPASEYNMCILIILP